MAHQYFDGCGSGEVILPYTFYGHNGIWWHFLDDRVYSTIRIPNKLGNNFCLGNFCVNRDWFVFGDSKRKGNLKSISCQICPYNLLKLCFCHKAKNWFWDSFPLESPKTNKSLLTQNFPKRKLFPNWDYSRIKTSKTSENKFSLGKFCVNRYFFVFGDSKGKES